MTIYRTPALKLWPANAYPSSSWAKTPKHNHRDQGLNL